MPDSLQSLVDSIPDTYKALATLATALTVGFLAALMLAGWVGVPQAVEANTQAILSNTRSIQSMQRDRATMERKVDRILCHLEEGRATNPTWERCER